MLARNEETALGMIALLIMPIVIEMITRGMVYWLVMSAIMPLAIGQMAERDLCALAWLPYMAIWIWSNCNGPEPLPPERAEYIPKNQRIEGENWVSRHVPESWTTTWNKWTMSAPGRSRRGMLGTKHCMYRYQKRTPSRVKQASVARNRSAAMAMKLVTLSCFAASTLGEKTRFDSDLKPITIDNCSSQCLTNSRSNFMPGMVNGCNSAILGVGGRVKCKIKGTVCWTIEDDQGQAHDIVIPDTPLCTDLPHRLFSPQHWAQETERTGRRLMLGALSTEIL
jgi:hypothetical protein